MPNFPTTTRLALESQIDAFVEETNLSYVLHALVEVVYCQVRHYSHIDPRRAEAFSDIARSLTAIELESEMWGL